MLSRKWNVGFGCKSAPRGMLLPQKLLGQLATIHEVSGVSVVVEKIWMGSLGPF